MHQSIFLFFAVICWLGLAWHRVAEDKTPCCEILQCLSGIWLRFSQAWLQRGICFQRCTYKMTKLLNKWWKGCKIDWLFQAHITLTTNYIDRRDGVGYCEKWGRTELGKLRGWMGCRLVYGGMMKYVEEWGWNVVWSMCWVTEQW